MDNSTLLVAAITLGVAAFASYVMFSGKKTSQKGTKRGESSKPAKSSKAQSTPDEDAFLDRKRKSVKLIEKENISHDTIRFRFGLDRDDQSFGLPTGKCIHIFAPNTSGVEEGMWNGREDKEAGKAEIRRSYTPTSLRETRGHFDLVIKVYQGGVIDRFPDGGKMSQYFSRLRVGDSIDVRGPFGMIEYLGGGQLSVQRKERPVRHIGMIAGGTGVTPMLQVIQHVLNDPEDTTQLSLLFANQTESDILVRDMLEEAAKDDRFSLWYTLDRPGEGWEYSTGFVDADMIKAHLPPPGEHTAILMCGPPPMIKFACRPNLEKLGYNLDTSCHEF